MSTLKKPVSDAKLTANRANARKSTGPRTPEGKARSSRNALTHGLTSSLNHGLTAEDLTALGEDLDLLPSLIQHFTASWNPTTPYENILVKRLAEIQVRRDRCARIETGLLDPNIGPVTPSDSRPTINSAIAGAFAEREASFNILSRYESNLSREFDRTQKQLIAARKENLPPVDLPTSRATDLPVCRPGNSNKTNPIPPQNKEPKNRRTGEFISPPEPLRPPVDLVWTGPDGNELEFSRYDRDKLAQLRR
jgi:hypothetical protein